MTEQEWLAATDPKPMLEFLRGNASDRKLRLLAAACCRRGERYFVDPCQVTAVNLLEKYADGRFTAEEMKGVGIAVGCFDANYFDENFPGEEAAYRTGCVVIQAVANRPLQQLCNHNSPHWLDDVIWGTASAAGYDSAMVAEKGSSEPSDEWEFHLHLNQAIESENLILTALFRELFGNPFRPVTVDPSWLTSDVRLLATGIYDEKAFDRLPILADALQDAGCGNDEIFNHCRSEGPHVRGCWVVDLVLGKS